MDEEQKTNSKILLKMGIIFSIVFFSIIILFLVYNSVFAQKIYLGVYVAGKNVGGMTYSELYNFLEGRVRQFDEVGINYNFENFSYNVNPAFSETESIGYKLIYFGNDKVAKRAYEFGRNSNIFENFINQISVFIYPKKLMLDYDFNKLGWENILKDEFSQYETEFILPKVVFQNGELEISEPQAGHNFNYSKIIQKTEEQINNFNFSDIVLELEIKESPINIKQASEKIDLVKKIINLEEIVLKYENKLWKIKSSDYKKWLVINKKDGDILVGLDFENYRKYLEDKIISGINTKAMDAKFSMKDGKVFEFVGSRDGKEVDLNKTLEDLENNLNNLEKETLLVVNITKSEIATKDVNDLGIKEIIGTGESDFQGSPKNRIHNIRVGADKLNGLLIAPGEEFFTIKNLLPIDAASGYLPELVIKGNRTVPEYGGGLCQIGTTMFRTAIQSGLKITQRREHSYRVVYYEPAGTDATIYDPIPDLRFINDTENYILIQSRIVGTKLYFDFWGTKDGRKIEITEPVIYNIVKPGPTKIIETTELKPGEKKCIESAHNGADAYFDYKIEYSDGTKHEERFRSHYVPWRAVCLIGITPDITTDEFSDNSSVDVEKLEINID